MKLLFVSNKSLFHESLDDAGLAKAYLYVSRKPLCRFDRSLSARFIDVLCVCVCGGSFARIDLTGAFLYVRLKLR